MDLAPAATIRQLVDRQADQSAGSAWVVASDTGAVITRGKLQVLCQELGRVLLMNGLDAGERVSLMMDNGYQTARLMIGIMYAGLVIQPLDLAADDAALEALLTDSPPRLVFAAHDQVDRLRAPLERVSGAGALDIALFPLNPDQIDIFDDPYIAHVPMPAQAPDDAAFLGAQRVAGGARAARVWTHRELLDAALALAADDRSNSTHPTPWTRLLCSLGPDPLPLIAALASGGCLSLAHLVPPSPRTT